MSIRRPILSGIAVFVLAGCGQAPTAKPAPFEPGFLGKSGRIVSATAQNPVGTLTMFIDSGDRIHLSWSVSGATGPATITIKDENFEQDGVGGNGIVASGTAPAGVTTLDLYLPQKPGWGPWTATVSLSQGTMSVTGFHGS